MMLQGQLYHDKSDLLFVPLKKKKFAQEKLNFINIKRLPKFASKQDMIYSSRIITLMVSYQVTNQ
jgi:hypothetical protein